MIDENKASLSLGRMAVVAAVVVVLWVLSGILLVSLVPTAAARGQFGDMFGSVNALFSGLALAGVVLTLFLQHHELAIQRQELKLTRKQFTRTAEAQEASEASLSRQATANERAAVIAGMVAVVDHYNIRIRAENKASRKLTLISEQSAHIDRLDEMLLGEGGAQGAAR